MILPNAICLESWRAGIANEQFKIYLLIKHKPASLLWLTGPILFLVFYIYMFVLITIFISLLITLWFSFLANLEWSSPRIGQLLRECKYTLTDFNTSFKFIFFKIRQVINSSLLLVLNSPLFICEFMSSTETCLQRTLIYTVRVNHVLLCLYFLDIYCVNTISNLVELLLLMCADVHPHPGPRIKSFSFCHWNLDSIIVENKVKIPLIEAISSVHKFDIIALSETYLNDTIPNNEIEIEGYSSDIFRSDHPTNTKRGGVCLYYKNTLPIKLRPYLHILDESIVVELTLSRKKLFFVVIYRSPCQSSDEFDPFLSRLELVIEHMRHEKPDCIILTGDFNSKTKQWWPDGEETNEGVLLNQLIESFSMTQLIDQPTHILTNSSSLIDLIITDQVDMFVDSGLLPSPSDKSYHEIINGKLNLAAPLPPPYKRRVWDYNEANHDLIKETLSNTNSEAIFENSTPDKAVKDFTDIILSTMSQFIPNKIITINERDPPWLTKSIKNKIKSKHRAYHKFLSRGSRPEETEHINRLHNEPNRLIVNARDDYFYNLGQKLSDLSLGPKSYWTVLNKILNKKK